MKRYSKHTVLVLTAYLLLTIIMTWPAVRYLRGAIPGDGFDGWQNYWNLWWVKQALLILKTTPFFTDYLYPPPGVSLLFHTLNIFNGLWTLPIQLNFGLAVAYNSVVFLSFVLAGYGGYLLSLDMLVRLNRSSPAGLRPAAFVGGLVFTMSPFHMAHLLGHMQVFSMIWPPFYVLWLLRTLDPWHKAQAPAAARKQWRNVILCCLFLILATLVDWYHTLYLLLFTALALLWTLGQRWARLKIISIRSVLSTLRPLGLVLAIGLGFGLVLSPLLGPMVRAAGRRPDLQTGLAQNITLSADLLAFVIPSEMHPLWGDWAQRIADNFSTTTSERLIFAGFVPLALGLFIAIRSWSRSVVRFWVLVTLVFVILALGPYLHVAGQIVSIGPWPIPMPYLLLYRTIPFIGLTRSLSRYDLMVMLALGVLVAMALAQLTKRLHPATQKPRPTSPGRARAVRYGLPLIAGLLICFEFLAVPYPISTIDTPDFYHRLAADPEDYTIAELPMDWDRPTPLLHQTTHGKRLLTAYTSRNNPLELVWRTPVLQQWRYLGPDIIDLPLELVAPTIFYDFNLRYIVLDYWQMPSPAEQAANERWVAAALPDTSPIYDDGRLKVYSTPPRQNIVTYLTLGDGWSERQVSDTGQVSRTFVAAGDNQPKLFLHHPEERALFLEITAASETPQTLTLLANEEPIGVVELNDKLTPYTVRLPWLAAHIVKLNFISDTPGGLIRVSRISLEGIQGCPDPGAHF